MVTGFHEPDSHVVDRLPATMYPLGQEAEHDCPFGTVAGQDNLALAGVTTAAEEQDVVPFVTQEPVGVDHVPVVHVTVKDPDAM